MQSFKTLSLSEFGLWLLIPFASFTNHTFLPVPPTMVLLFLAGVCWMVQIIAESNSSGIQSAATGKNMPMDRSLRKAIVTVGIFALYLFISQYFLTAPFRRYMGAILAPLYFIFIVIFAQSVPFDLLKKLGEKFIRYSLVLLCIEAVYRYAISFWKIFQNTYFDTGFYTFKHHSLLYSNSNVVAIHLILLLFFMLWWSRTHQQRLKKEIAITFLLLALTLSRTAIPAVGAGLVYDRFFRNAGWRRSLVLLGIFSMVGVLGFFALKSSFLDESFQSKFLILNEVASYFQNTDLKAILFGLGFSETDRIMIFSAHNYFLLFLMESGLFGLLFLCATLFVFIKTSGGKAMLVLLPFFVQTATGSATFLPYFYVIMALMTLTAKTDCLPSHQTGKQQDSTIYDTTLSQG